MKYILSIIIEIFIEKLGALFAQLWKRKQKDDQIERDEAAKRDNLKAAESEQEVKDAVKDSLDNI